MSFPGNPTQCHLRAAPRHILWHLWSPSVCRGRCSALLATRRLSLPDGVRGWAMETIETRARPLGSP
jgi:hypothetical protein